MQKKIIAIAVAVAALASTVAMADVTIYGKAHMSVDSESGYAAAGKGGASLSSNASRLGVKGSQDLNDGMKAIYQLEIGVALDGSGTSGPFNSTRDSFVGLSGGFGTVMAGRLPLANQYVYDVNFFDSQVGDAANFTGAGNSSRVNNTIAYKTPSMSGFSAMAAFVPRTANSQAATKESSYTLRGAYADGPVKLGLSYQKVANNLATVDAKYTSLGGTYNFGAATVGLQYVRTTDRASTAGNDQNIYTLGGSFKVADNATVKAQYAKAGNLGATANSGANMFALGYDYSFFKNTIGYVAYARTSNDTAAAFKTAAGYSHNNGGVTVGPVPANGDDPSAFSVGLVYSF